MKRILFVDDELKLLEGLKRMLYPRRDVWEMFFVTSGQRALELLAQSEFDLLVTDIRMPGMTGIELLDAVVKRHSQVIRFVLSGTTDQELTLRSVALAHQYLVKPCDAETLRGTIERALSFRMLMDQPALKPLVSGVNKLPSVPSAYGRLLTVLQDPDASVSEIGTIISGDLAMSAKIMQMVNSAFFGLRRRIRNPADAVAYLGIETVKALALTIGAFSQFQVRGHFNMEELRAHSVRVGALARLVATAMEGPKGLVDDCFTGGLLHDIGKLVLSANYPEQYDRALLISGPQNIPLIDAEREVFGVSHAAVGGYLLWLWGLPDPVIDAVVRHHDEIDAPEETASPATIVGFADALIHQLPEEAFDMEAFRHAGLTGDLAHWQGIANEMLAPELAHVEKNSLC